MHLGTLITADGRCIKENNCRIADTKAAFHKNKEDFKSNLSLSIEVRNRGSRLVRTRESIIFGHVRTRRQMKYRIS